VHESGSPTLLDVLRLKFANTPELSIWGTYSHTDEGETLAATLTDAWREFGSPERDTVAFTFRYKTEIPERALNISTDITDQLPAALPELTGTESCNERIENLVSQVIETKCQSSLNEKFVNQRERFVLGVDREGNEGKPSVFSEEEKRVVFNEFVEEFRKI
jgi:hypothetical protein